jgi:diguanylate cyclase (GGDEF)-like protein/PAS domain S-box-containing protein
MEKVRNYKKHIFIPAMLAIIILLGIFLFISYLNEKSHITDEMDKTMKSSQSFFVSFLNSDANKMEGTLHAILRDEKLKAAMKARDRKALLARSRSLFEQLHSNVSITHFYFTDPDRVNILRVHKPEKYGDRIDRFTTMQAEQTGNISPGIELGPLGTFTLRVVAPWFDGKQLIGYVELGEEIDHILSKVRNALDIELFVVIEKQYLNRENWESGMEMLGYQADWDRFPSVVLITKDQGNFPDKLAQIFSSMNYKSMMKRLDFSAAESRYVCDFISLKDAGNRNVGIMVVVRDITALEAEHHKYLFVGIGISLVVGLFLILFLYIIFDRVELQRKKAHSLLHATIESTAEGILVVDKNGVITAFNKKFLEMWHIPKSVFDVRDHKKPLAFVMEQLKDPEGFMKKIKELYAHPDAKTSDTLEFKDGRVFERYSQPQYLDGKITGRLWSFKDITERKEAEEALRDSEQSYKTLAENLPGIVYRVFTRENARVTLFNKLGQELTGYKDEELNEGEVCAMESKILQEDRPGVVAKVLHAILNHVPFTVEYRFIRKDGSIRYFLEKGTPLYGKDGNLLYIDGVIFDITDYKQAEMELKRLAAIDYLTGVFNRTTFKELIEREIERAQRYNKPLSMIMFDIDHFKKVNDTYGHSVGDYVLKTLAKIVREAIRKIDYLVRWGGEEFLIILPENNLDKAQTLAERIRQIIEHYTFDNVGKVTVSLGVAEFKEGDTEDTLINNSDSAMLKAKRKGRNRVEVHI